MKEFSRYSIFLVLQASFHSLVGGCGSLGLDESSLTIVGINDEEVFYQFYPEDSGFVTLPSSLWKIDVQSGASKRIREAVKQFGLQVDGDYYVTEIALNDERLGRIVAVQISTDRRSVLHERPLVPAASDPIIHLLRDDRVILLTSDGLSVYELNQDHLLKTLALPIADLELIAFDGRHVFLDKLNKDSSDGFLVDVDTEEFRSIPLPPGNVYPLYVDAILSYPLLVTSGWEQLDEDRARNELLLFNAEANSWQSLVQYDVFDFEDGIPPVVFVTGFDGETVIASLETWGPVVEWSVEAVPISTGARSVITKETGTVFMAPVFAKLHDGSLYWVDSHVPAIVIHDLGTDDRRFVPLSLP